MHILTEPYPTLARLRGMIALMRPKQWIKNGFVLAPLVFTGNFLNHELVRSALFAVVFFCIASSATYIVNDIKDVKYDRLHPTKSKTRPLAAGIVTIHMAIALLILLYVLIAVGLLILPSVGEGIIGYLLLSTAYTFYLKHQPVIDIFSIALGFVLRVYVGAVALAVPLSGWMGITTLCLALYLAALKRRQELVRNGTGGRQVLRHYTVALVDRYAEMSGAGAMIFYSLFVMSVKPALVITIPFVLFGLFRYWYVVEALEEGESPTDALLADWQLSVSVIVWCGISAWVFWPAKG